MEFWESIDGWFNFEDLYLDMIGKYDNAVFVEIGCWKGKSAGFMGLRIKESGKNIKFYAIDVFAPYEQNGEMVQGVTLDEFLVNTETVKEYIIPIKGSSREAYSQFEDNSVDFVFIDGNHTYDAVLGDIKLWYPKIKKGGIIAGHDYQWGGVKQAVDEYFGSVEILNNSGSWKVTK